MLNRKPAYALNWLTVYSVLSSDADENIQPTASRGAGLCEPRGHNLKHKFKHIAQWTQQLHKLI